MLRMESYKQLSHEERVKVYELRQSKASIPQIAVALGRHRTTITRELRRNAAPPGHYWPDTAQRLAHERRKKGLLLDRDVGLREFVVSQLCSFQWSPEQIAGHLKYRQTALHSISHETIYAWIYTKPREKLWKHLARHKAKRGPRKYRKSGVSRIPERISIHDRPECKGFGHWEGDLMSFRKNSQHILVSHEKHSLFVVSKRLLNKTAKHTAKMGLSFLKKLPLHARKSMTLDNGGEFAKHTEWRTKLGIQTYFCDPYASWQKGSVENTNGRLRRDLPRQTDVHALSEDEFDEIIFNHNTKPRKRLAWKTPLEVFKQNLYNVALQT